MPYFPSLIHALLDGSYNSDTLAAAVVRGDIIIGNSTPAWSRKAVGTGVLAADGTDVTGWTQAPTLTTPSMTVPVVSTSINLTGGQITFPATQVPSAGANTLDDYEEGSWTPGIAFGAVETGITYSARAGRYIKIGKMVFLCGSWTLTSKGAAVGNASIVGLPFTSSGNSPSCMFLNRTGNLTTITGLTGSLPVNGTTVNLADYVGTVANNTHFQNTTFTDGMMAVYEASA